MQLSSTAHVCKSRGLHCSCKCEGKPSPLAWHSPQQHFLFHFLREFVDCHRDDNIILHLTSVLFIKTLDMWGLRGWAHSYCLHNMVFCCFPCCDLQAPHSVRSQVMEQDRNHDTLLVRSVSSPTPGEYGETIHQVNFMCNA